MPMTGYWLIRSSSEQGGGRFYNLTRYEEKCPCALRCSHCKVCIHAYRCSCHDNSIKSNMCKHIHLLCRFLKESMPETEVEDINQSGDLYIHTSPQLEARAEEVNVHVSSLVKNSCGNELDLDGAKSFFLSTCDLVADTEGLRILNEAIKTGNALLRTHNSSHNRLVAPKMVTLVSPLSKIDKQLRFIPKKKKASETAVRENNNEVVARLIMRNKFSCSPIAPDAGGTDVAIETDGVNSLVQENTLSATKEDEDNMKIGSRRPSVSDTLGLIMPNVGSSACSSPAVSPGVLSILSPSLSSASPTRNEFTTGRSLIPIAVRPSVLSIGHGVKRKCDWDSSSSSTSSHTSSSPQPAANRIGGLLSLSHGLSINSHRNRNNCSPTYTSQFASASHHHLLQHIHLQRESPNSLETGAESSVSSVSGGGGYFPLFRHVDSPMNSPPSDSSDSPHSHRET